MTDHFEMALAEHDARVSRRKSSRKRPEPVKDRRVALQALSAQAKTFGDWLAIYYRANSGSALETHALERIEACRATTDELFEALEFAPDESPLRNVLKQKLLNRGITDLRDCEKAFSVRSTGTL